MKHLLFFMLVNVLTQSYGAPTEINLYAKIPNLKDGNPPSEIKKNNGDLYNVTNPTLTVYLPAKPLKSKAAVLICPGGGYGFLAINKEGYQVAERFAEYGFVAFVLKYRLPNTTIFNNSPYVPLQDAEQAMAVIRTNATKWNVNPNEVGVAGFSAGGHLAAMLLAHAADTNLIDNKKIALNPNWVILGYPVTTVSTEYGMTGTRKNLVGIDATKDVVNYFSPYLWLNAKLAPVFVFMAEDDKTVDPMHSVIFYNAMLKNGEKGELHAYQGGGHGFGLFNPFSKENWFLSALNWLHANHFAS